jgi:hypothetical protein
MENISILLLLGPISVYSMGSVVYVLYTVFFGRQKVHEFIYENVSKSVLTLFQIFGTISILLWINITLSLFDAIGPKFYNEYTKEGIIFWWNSILPAKYGDLLFILILLNIGGCKAYLLLNYVASILKKGPVQAYRQGIFTIYKNK